MAYQQITFSALKTLAGYRMGNSTFFLAAELGVYLNEALRVWNLLVRQFKNRQTITTTANTIFYSPSSLISCTVTDQNLLNAIQYHVAETPNNGASWTTDTWTAAGIQAWLNDRYHLFNRETKLVLTAGSLNTTAEIGRYNLNDESANLVQLIRLAWLDINGVSYELQPADTLGYDWMRNTWHSSYDTPLAYTLGIAPQTYIDIIPAPDDTGSLHLTYTELGTTLSNSGVALSRVPNDFTPYVKWGALADMHRQGGQGNDPIRAAYCEARFHEGIALAHGLGPTWRVEYNNQPLDQTSLFALDNGNPGWQANSSTPVSWFPYGMTQIGINPADSAGNNSLVVDGLTNAPQLSADGDYLNLGQWEIEALLDYTEHIASFKLGGKEFLKTYPLYGNFLAAAVRRGMDLDFSEIYRKFMGSDADEILQPLAERSKLR